MKFLVIGCGSIGKRHIRNLLFLNAGEIMAFDIDKKKLSHVKDISSSIIVSNDLKRFWEEKPQIVFITVPTALHISYAIQAGERGCHLFIEKPLSHNMQKVNRLIKTVKQKRLITMVGCNMRFYWAIKKIKNLLEKDIIGKVIFARIEAGQYLPDWHPWEDYRQMYAAQKRLGGGVILDGIHEFDYAMWFFGSVERTKSIYGILSNLEIDTEDTAEILLKFRNGPITNIHMDYVQRVYSRSCKIVGEEGTIYWNFNEHYVNLYLAKTKKWQKYYEPEKYHINQMYIDEIKYFLNCVKQRKKTINDISTSVETLKVALSAKRQNL